VKARFPLRTVLRVRQIREDLARAEAAAAGERTRSAVTEHARREAALVGRPEPGTAESAQWLAGRAAALAMAGDVFAAHGMIELRRAEAAAATEHLALTYRDREGVENLADRYARRLCAEQEATEQRAADDRAGRRLPRAPEDLP
jgi:hypothetical protein